MVYPPDFNPTGQKLEKSIAPDRCFHLPLGQGTQIQKNSKDGKVDYADILMLATLWGKTYSLPITTPSEAIKFNIDQNDLYMLLMQLSEN